MTHDTTLPGDRESPARRLGILYVASFCMVAVLTGVSQAFILRELAWQAGAIRSVAHFDRQRSLEHPLSSAALAALDAEGGGTEGSLRGAIARSRSEASAPPGGPAAESPRLLRQAEAHRLSAVKAAEELLVLLGGRGRAPVPAAEVVSLVRRVVASEDAFGRAAGDAARASEGEAVARVQGLRSFELQLFGLVVVVLALEGLFVVNPAVKKIQHFMDHMGRSNEELKVYAAKLERSNKELQDFASVASHDLQEPLRKVQAFSDRLKSKYAGAVDDQGRDYLDRIQNAAKRMQTLINDLLTYARVSTKAQPFVPTDLVAITNEVVSDLETRIEEAHGRVEVGDLPSVEADPLQVRQLMQNLIGNSLKYKRPDVPPVVKVSGRNLAGGAPAPGAPAPDPVCEILVEDNGIGFDEVYTDRIFTIFQRLHGRTEYEGTGVGLAVCRKIVERHGGAITARSTPGAGSTFIVTLPVRQPKEPSPDGR